MELDIIRKKYRNYDEDDWEGEFLEFLTKNGYTNKEAVRYLDILKFNQHVLFDWEKLNDILYVLDDIDKTEIDLSEIIPEDLENYTNEMLLEEEGYDWSDYDKMEVISKVKSARK